MVGSRENRILSRDPSDSRWSRKIAVLHCFGLEHAIQKIRNEGYGYKNQIPSNVVDENQVNRGSHIKCCNFKHIEV